MVMDFYEMTMSNGYFNNHNTDERVAFDVFYRKNPDGGGFAMGDAVIAHLIEECPSARVLRDAALAPRSCDVYLALAAAEMRPQMLLLASTLRDAGVRVDLPLSTVKLSRQLRHAERLGATYTAIIGAEFPSIELKRMATRDSEKLTLEELICALIPHKAAN